MATPAPSYEPSYGTEESGDGGSYFGGGGDGGDGDAWLWLVLGAALFGTAWLPLWLCLWLQTRFH